MADPGQLFDRGTKQIYIYIKNDGGTKQIYIYIYIYIKNNIKLINIKYMTVYFKNCSKLFAIKN